MLHPLINWNAYLLICAVASACYYGFIFFKYYRKQLVSFRTSLFSSQPKLPEHSPVTPSSPLNPDVKIAPASRPSSDLSSLIHDMTDELRALLIQSAAQSCDKPKLSVTLQGLLHKYSILKGSEFEMPIRALIISEALTYCAIQFTETEIASFWQ